MTHESKTAKLRGAGREDTRRQCSSVESIGNGDSPSPCTRSQTAKYFGVNGKIPAFIQGMIDAIAIILVVALIIPWGVKFLSWYYPWVQNV